MPNTACYRILLVDDDEVDRESVVRALRRGSRKYDLVQASNASVGQELLDNERWDCVVLDYRFPEGDAFGLFPDLFHDSCAERPPVVLLTGLGDEKLASDALRGGAQDYLSKKDLSSTSLWEAINNATASARAIRAQAENLEELKRKSMHDVLTGLPNRALFADRLEQQIQLASRRGEQFTVMMVDLDRFKAINDEHGHGAGDHVLATIADRLKETIRNSDTIARFGGDEFAVLLVTAQDQHGARVVARKLIEAAQRPIDFDGVRLEVGASVGMALWPVDGRTEAALLERADADMYRAKRAGREPCAQATETDFDPDLTASIARQVPGGESLGGIRVLYQPRVDLSTHRVDGRETVVRWQHPNFGHIPLPETDTWVESDTRSWPLIRLAIDHALGSWKNWQRAGVPVPVSVSVSAFLLTGFEFSAYIEERLAHHDVPPSCLTVAISEPQLAGRCQTLGPSLVRLSATGVRIAVNDFASGWLSADYMDEFPVSDIKLNRRFIQMAMRDPATLDSLQSVVEYASNRDIKVVADGVDSDSEWVQLINLGCNSGLGTRFSPALVSSACLPWCLDWHATRRATSSAISGLNKIRLIRQQARIPKLRNRGETNPGNVRVS